MLEILRILGHTLSRVVLINCIFAPIYEIGSVHYFERMYDPVLGSTAHNR